MVLRNQFLLFCVCAFFVQHAVLECKTPSYSNLSCGISRLCCVNNSLYINESPLMYHVS
jgi:hypothetical protein